MPPADQQQPDRRHARWGTQLEESRWLHTSFATPVAVRNRCSKEGAALEHSRAAGATKVRLRTGLSTDVRPRACAQRRRSKITRAMRRRHHVLIRIRRWKEGRPLADSHKAWLMQAGFAASLPYRRLKQRAQGTAATASVSAVPATRRRNHWNGRSRPRNACGVKRRRRPGIAGAAGGNSGNIGLYPLCLGPLKCPFSKGFVSGFLIFKSPENPRWLCCATP
eukprot:COSAG06_NODE_8170_length_2251_cov_1.970260_1_plen_222_part_00